VQMALNAYRVAEGVAVKGDPIKTKRGPRARVAQ